MSFNRNLDSALKNISFVDINPTRRPGFEQSPEEKKNITEKLTEYCDRVTEDIRKVKLAQTSCKERLYSIIDHQKQFSTEYFQKLRKQLERDTRNSASEFERRSQRCHKLLQQLLLSSSGEDLESQVDQMKQMHSYATISRNISLIEDQKAIFNAIRTIQLSQKAASDIDSNWNFAEAEEAKETALIRALEKEKEILEENKSNLLMELNKNEDLKSDYTSVLEEIAVWDQKKESLQKKRGQITSSSGMDCTDKVVYLASILIAADPVNYNNHLMDFMACCTWEQRVSSRVQYAHRFGQDLIENIRNRVPPRVSNHFVSIFDRMTTPWLDFEARRLNDYLEPKKLNYLIHLILMHDEQSLVSIKNRYHALFPTHYLDSEKFWKTRFFSRRTKAQNQSFIINYLSSAFGASENSERSDSKHEESLTVEPMPNTPANPEPAQEDTTQEDPKEKAFQLINTKSVKKNKRSEAVCTWILSFLKNSNAEFRKAVEAKYNELAQETLEQLVENTNSLSKSNGLGKILLSTLKRDHDKTKFILEYIVDLLKNFRNNKQQLLDVFISRSEMDLDEIRELYHTQNNPKTLQDFITASVGSSPRGAFLKKLVDNAKVSEAQFAVNSIPFIALPSEAGNHKLASDVFMMDSLISMHKSSSLHDQGGSTSVAIELLSPEPLIERKESQDSSIMGFERVDNKKLSK